MVLKLTEDRRLRGKERPTLPIVVTWLGFTVLLILFSAAPILHYRLPDADDVLRLAQVRDLVSGQSWFDLHQYRITPPDGTLMPLSRLVDMPVAGLILLFSLVMETAQAERVALVAVPLIALLFTMLAIGQLASRLFDRQTAFCAALAAIAMPMMVFQFQPMRIADFSWQVLAVMVAVLALTGRTPSRGGAVAGMAMAIGLSISLALSVIAAAIGIVLALRWIRDHRQRWWLVSYLQALAMGLVAVFALTRGLNDLAPHCDVIAPPHLGLFLIVALAAGALAALPPLPRLPLALALAGFVVLGLAFAGFNAPQCLTYPFAGPEVLARDPMAFPVIESRPLWQQPISRMVPAVLQPLFAGMIALYLASIHRDWQRVWWFEYAALLLVALGSGLFMPGSIVLAGALSAVPMGWFLARLFRRWRVHDTVLPRAMIALVICLALVPGPLIRIAWAVASKPGGEQTEVTGAVRCVSDIDGSMLNRLPPSTFLAPSGIGAELLLHTHHAVVAVEHRRSEQAMRDVNESFAGTPEQARQIIDRYGADYVAACMVIASHGEDRVAGTAGSLMDRLAAGRGPDWLEPVESGRTSPLKVWRVIRK